MNYISHHEVALQYLPTASPDFLFGACASDFARMAEVRRVFSDAENHNPDLEAGLQLHTLTNKPAFDGQLVMAELEVALRMNFEEFLPPRTARQASRVSKDLLFDGIHFNQPEVIERLQTTLGAVLDGTIEVGTSLPPSLLRVLNQIYENGPPRYDQVPEVSKRLAVVLSKTRTPILMDTLPAINRVLASCQPYIFEIGPMVMAETVSTLRSLQ